MGKGSTPTKSSNAGIPITFVGLGEGETPPKVALYALDASGKPTKLAAASNGMIPYPLSRLQSGGQVAIGPDVANAADLKSEQLLVYRVDEISKVWAGQGLVLPKARWGDIFYPMFRCVHGKVRKCRPFWWDIITEVKPVATKGIKYSRALALHSQAISQISAANTLGPIIYPWRCVPICEGRVIVYERLCCCDIVVLPDLLDRIRDILQRIPVPWPPIPEPDPPPYRMLDRPIARAPAPSTVSQNFDMSEAPPQRLYEAYNELLRLPPAEAHRFVLDREWLHPFFCNDCTIKKVGQTSIQPDGSFDFCYPRGRPPFNCSLTYSYRVQQFINGYWQTVYNGPAAGAWFSGSEEADVRVVNPKAIPCSDLDFPPPPNDTGLPFIMLNHVGVYPHFHYQFPDQIAASRMGPLSGNHGLYTVNSVPDCPWDGSLRLVLSMSRDLAQIATYYRLSVVEVDANGVAIGTPEQLHAPITWTWRSASQSGSEKLGPDPVNTETNLYKIPYPRANSNEAWDPGQWHQLWNTRDFDSGRHMLILEVFNSSGVRVTPASAGAGPGLNPKPFAFLRWQDAVDTKEVPFANCAHIFWTDKVDIFGDIVDLRKNGQPNATECQYMRGNADDTFSIGYRAYHVHGVSDSDSFMMTHSIRWQRGLNGPTGALAPAVSDTTDVGEPSSGPAAQSGAITFGELLDGQTKCTFSVTLKVWAKHWDGINFVREGYEETASFALDMGPPIGGP